MIFAYPGGIQNYAMLRYKTMKILDKIVVVYRELLRGIGPF
jgi:hypothetical protein